MLRSQLRAQSECEWDSNKLLRLYLSLSFYVSVSLSLSVYLSFSLSHIARWLHTEEGSEQKTFVLIHVNVRYTQLSWLKM